MLWYTPNSISAISAGYSLNLTGEGLYGVSTNDLIYLSTYVNPNVTMPSKSPYTTVNITVLKENNVGVDTLGFKNFRIDYFNTQTQIWQTAKINQIINYGGGKYSLNITKQDGSSIPSPYNKYLIVWVTDDRGIVTESYTYTSVQYVLKENAVHQFYPSSNQSSEVYTLESISNGSVLWFGKPLKTTSGTNVAPIPLPPVKQLRVYTNTTGTFQLVPSQTEVWTANYSYPTLNFANWRTRFTVGDKLVYFVSFANTNGKNVAVKITWLPDADAPPPQYRLNINTSAGFVDISNGVYTLRLLNNVKLSLSIDYSISMRFNGYHIETELSAVGWITQAGWEPHFLPGGDWNDTTTTSFIIEGPVRAVAFRSTSNDTVFNYNSNTNQFTEQYLPNGPLTHTDIILVPYNVQYAELFETYTWTSSWRDYNMFNLITLIAGVSTASGSPADPTSRPTNWAFVTRNGTKIVTGAYSLNPGVIKIDTTPADIGAWFTMYNKSIGEAVIGGDNYITALTQRSINTFQNPTVAYMIWNSGDGARDAFWASPVYWKWNTPTTITINPQSFSYTAALWVYNGFTGNNYAALPPNIYYRMFNSTFYPTIIFSNVSSS